MANYRPASFALFNQIFVSGIFEETVGSVFFVIINESAAWLAQLSPATALLTSVLIRLRPRNHRHGRLGLHLGIVLKRNNSFNTIIF